MAAANELMADGTPGPSRTASTGRRRPPGHSRSRAGGWSLLARSLTHNGMALSGACVVGFMVLFSVVGPLLYRTQQVSGNLSLVDLAPSSLHLLGTDDNGFDVLGRLMVGGRVSLEVGLCVAVMATLVGVVVGSVSGYLGGVVDAVLMRLVDIGIAVPPVYLFIFLSLVFKPGVDILIVILGSLSWFVPARLIRAETLSLRTRDYAVASKGMGARRSYILVRHVVPNAFGTIVVNATFQVADAVIVLALLNYLGFSLPPTIPTWGGMLSSGTQFLADGYWWQVYPPLLVIVVTVVAFNLLGDGMRDALDVRLIER